MFSWPSTLPQAMLIDGYSESPKENSIASDMEGWRTTRPMFTVGVTHASGSIMCTKAQLATLKDFYENSIAFGNDRFIWKLPTSDVNQEFKFMERYEITPASGLFLVAMAFEVFPLTGSAGTLTLHDGGGAGTSVFDRNLDGGVPYENPVDPIDFGGP